MWMCCGCDVAVDVSVDVGVVWMWFKMWVWRGSGGGAVDVVLDVVRMWCWMWVGVFVDDDFFCASDIVGENSETVTSLWDGARTVPMTRETTRNPDKPGQQLH